MTVNSVKTAFVNAWHHAFTLQFVFVALLRIMSILGVVLVAIIIYGMFFEKPYIRYQNLPFPVVTPVEQGRTVPIVIERCNDSGHDVAYMSSRILRDVVTNQVTLLPSSTLSLPAGCSRDITRSVIIPRETLVGRYIIEGEVVSQGILKQHRIPWYTEPFEVIPTKRITKQLEEDNEMEVLREALKRGIQ